MNIFIGIDAIEINRFAHFHTYKPTQLTRLFSPQEITYCLATPTKSAERFAVRFAAKEALYKALTQLQGNPPCPLLELFKYVEIQRSPHPTFLFSKKLSSEQLIAQISMTHTKKLAFAQVLLQKKI